MKLILIDKRKLLADAANYYSLTKLNCFLMLPTIPELMIGSTNKLKHLLLTAPRRPGAKRRVIVWLALISWLFSTGLCATESLASGSSLIASVDSDMKSETPQGSSNWHHHPGQPHTDSCCTLQDIPVPASAISLPVPLYDQIVAIPPLLLILPLILFIPFRTRIQITGPPGRTRFLLLVHSISPNAPPR